MKTRKAYIDCCDVVETVMVTILAIISVATFINTCIISTSLKELDIEAIRNVHMRNSVGAGTGDNSVSRKNGNVINIFLTPNGEIGDAVRQESVEDEVAGGLTAKINTLLENLSPFVPQTPLVYPKGYQCDERANAGGN